MPPPVLRCGLLNAVLVPGAPTAVATADGAGAGGACVGGGGGGAAGAGGTCASGGGGACTGGGSSAARRTRRRIDEGSSSPRAEDGGCRDPPADDQSIQLRVDIESLFDDESLSDVLLVIDYGVERRRFRCHKVILASMSSYFLALFMGGMQESKQQEVVLQAPGVDPDCCEQVLRLLYGQPVHITPDNLLTFMHLADFYGVPQLLARTEKVLETCVTVQANNCCAKLAEATALRCTQAQRHCLRVLLEDFGAAIQQKAFLQLEQSVIAEVLAHDELKCRSEEVVLNGLITWFQAQEASGACIDELLPLVRWPLLSMKTLANVEHRLSALRGNPLLCELLLEGFRYHSADATTKVESRASTPRCRPRKGMLLLQPLLPEGRWIPKLPLPTIEGSPMPSSLTYVWNIPHFSALSCLSMYSPAFQLREHHWKIYVYPKGNNNQGKQLSLYLDSGITDTQDHLQCTFKLAVINYKQLGEDGPRINVQATVVKEAHHTFNKRAKDWGFREFMSLDRLNDSQSGYLNEGAISIGVLIELAP